MTNNVRIEQMELSLGRSVGPRSRRGRAHRLMGAQWWFAQMRAAIERATDWQNSPPSRLATKTQGGSAQ